MKMLFPKHFVSARCWIVVATLLAIGNCASISLSPERWARGEELSDGWVGSMSPYPVGSESPAPLQQVHTTVGGSTGAPAAKLVEEFVPSTTPSAEGLYEVVVGKKSPMTESVGNGGSSTASGSPDVIIGRVMPTLKSINFPTTSTSAVTGQTHQIQPEVKSSDAAQVDEDDNDDDDDAATENTEDSDEVKATTVEADERSAADSGEDASTEEAVKRSDVKLPPGSFYLPAVSNEPGEYYSESEQSIYIPLRRPEVEPQPYASSPSVVFVRGAKAHSEQPPPPTHRSKDDEDEEEEDEEQVNSSEEAQDDVDESAPRPLSAPPAVPIARVPPPPPPPPKAQAGSLDLVMTLYPNLPKLLPQTHLAAAHTLQSVLERNKAPAVNSVSSAGSTLRVIHDAKKVAPPQGYLPQLLPKPALQPSHQQPASNQPGKSFVTQLKSPTKTQAFNSPIRPHQAPTSAAQVPSSPAGTAIKYTPFTADDISPLNFLLPSSNGHPLEKTTTSAEQKSTTIAAQKTAPVLPSSQQSRDRFFQPSAPIAHDPLKIVPAPTIDLTRNSVASNHETSFRPVLGSSHAHGGSSREVNANQHHHQPQGKQNFKPPQQVNQQSGEAEANRQQPSSTHQVIRVPGDMGEIVVRTRMAASVGSGDNFVRIPGSVESAEVIVGYIDDLPTDKVSGVKYDVQPFFPGQEKTLFKPHLPQKHSLVGSESHKFHQHHQPAAKANQRVPSNKAASTGHSSGESLQQSLAKPEMQGDFRPLLNPQHHVKSQDLSHQQSQVIADLPLSLESAESPRPVASSTTTTPAPTIRPSHDDEEDVYAAPRLPEILDDQHVAGSQIHEATVYDVNLPRIRTAKPSGIDADGKSSPHYYKPGKVSPKGAMYTVTQGHSKVKFFGFNALHKGDIKRVDGDDKYLLLSSDGDLEESEWRFTPYFSMRNNPALPPVEKKKVDIVPHKKSAIRPVFYAKRPAEGSADNSGWSPSILLSNPYEYHAQLQKISEESGRLPSKA